MFSTPFTTPVCTLFGSRLHSPVPPTQYYLVKVIFDAASAKVVRGEMRQFLRAAFGRIEGSRAAVPLVAMSGDRSLLDLFSTSVPAICDASGYPCEIARMPRNSLVRVSGVYERMTTPAIAPLMAAIQICKPAEATGRLFEPFAAE